MLRISIPMFTILTVDWYWILCIQVMTYPWKSVSSPQILWLVGLEACASTRKDPASRMVQGERKNCIGGKIIDGHLELSRMNVGIVWNSLTDSPWHLCAIHGWCDSLESLQDHPIPEREEDTKEGKDFAFVDGSWHLRNQFESWGLSVENDRVSSLFGLLCSYWDTCWMTCHQVFSCLVAIHLQGPAPKRHCRNERCAWGKISRSDTCRSLCLGH